MGKEARPCAIAGSSKTIEGVSTVMFANTLRLVVSGTTHAGSRSCLFALERFWFDRSYHSQSSMPAGRSDFRARLKWLSRFGCQLWIGNHAVQMVHSSCRESRASCAAPGHAPLRIKARHMLVTPGPDALEKLLKRCGIVLEEAQIERLWRYHRMLRRPMPR